MVDPRAGQPAAAGDLVDVAKLVTAYYALHPDPGEAAQRVSFGTSGHRGSAFTATFNEDHILATTQAICEYRAGHGIDGPLFLGADTHALSEPAQVSALEVLAANGVQVLIDARGGYTPTPAVSRAILAYNADRAGPRADGIVVTPSHNPPPDGGFKYNPPDGGPAGTDITKWIQDRANELLADGLKAVRRVPYARAAAADTTEKYDFLADYLGALPRVIDLPAIRGAQVRIGADPLGGASVAYWGEIASYYDLDLTVVNPLVDPTFRFMTLDWDGKIRMDCSSPHAMASLIARQHDFTIATGNDTDADRHGIVTPDGGLKAVRRVPYARAMAADTTGRYDFLAGYLSALPRVVDLPAIRAARVRIGADPLGGASVAYWGEIASYYDLDLTVVNPGVDPTFRFMTLDWDGKIRMDCSSPYAMASLIARQHEFTIATGNDTDADRHGIVTPDGGLMNPNHYLAVAIDYLYQVRDGWPEVAAVGKTLVSSSMIDRVTSGLGRTLLEVPVGFKWFVPGLLDGSVAFGGEESAGASFLQRDGSVWTTDKDGIILALLASEITAVTGYSPSEQYEDLVEHYGNPVYARIDSPATREQKAALARLSPSQVAASELAGEPIIAALTSAPGNGAPIGGLKVVAESGWFAARPSGTEDVYKLYAESFRGPEHLAAIQEQAREIIAAAIGS